MFAGIRAAAATDAAAPTTLDATLDAHAREEWAYAAGLTLWMWGLPLLRTEQLRRWMMAAVPGAADVPFAPLNQLGHMRRLPTSASQLPFTPNVDTLYSGAMLELADNPMVLCVPALPDRYWSVQVVDAWLSNLRYLGTRATGTAAQAWLFVSPDWEGPVPEGLRLYRAHTRTVVLGLRVRVEGPGDEPAANAVQDQFHLVPLATWLRGERTAAPPGRPSRTPMATHELAFFETLCDLLIDNPPRSGDASIVASMRLFGLEPGAPVVPERLDPAFRRGLLRALAEGPKIIAWKVKFRGQRDPAGWNVDLSGGRYGSDWLARAEGAVQGLLVHDAEECVYFHTYHDAEGAPLDGGRSYILRIGPEQAPPIHPGGFWSITAYNTRFLLIAHPAGRTSVQSSDPGLTPDADGGYTLHTGPTLPPGVHPSRWLSTEPGQLFRLNYRIYLPKGPLLAHETVPAYLPQVRPA